MNKNLDIHLLCPEDECATRQVPQTPVTAIDVDRSPPMCMHLPMADMCPRCGGNCMQVGDYVCWGFCWRCYKQDIKNLT